MVIRVNLGFGAVQQNICEIRDCSKRNIRQRSGPGTPADTRVGCDSYHRWNVEGEWSGVRRLGWVLSPWTENFKGDESIAEHATAIDMLIQNFAGHRVRGVR